MDNYTEIIKDIVIKIHNKEEKIDTLSRFNKYKISNSLILMINNELENYNVVNDISFLETALLILDKLIPNDKVKEIDKIHSIVSRLLDLHNSNNTLIRILNIIENKMNNYVKTDNTNDEAIISYVLFQIKDYNTFKKILNNNSDIVNTVDKNGHILIKRVIYHYILGLKKYLETNDRSDLYFYNKVFYKILKNPSFKITNSERDYLKKKIEEYLNNLNIPSGKEDELTYYKNKLILGIYGDTTTDLSIENLNYEYGISDKFPLPFLGEVNKIELLNSDIPNPSNNRRIYTFDHNPNEIDDGISIERIDGVLIVGIHIANPTMYIPNDSIILKEARNRTESIYIDIKEDKPLCIPMIPLKLSQDLMGLNANKNVYNLSFYYWYDELSGKLIKQEVREEPINVKYNFDYSEYDKIIKYGKDEQLIQDLINLEKSSNIISKKYDNTFINELLGNNNRSARGIRVVTNLMIGNNMNMAQYFKDNELPFAFRNHKLDENKEIKENLKAKVLARNPIQSTFKMLNILEEICPNAKYSPICLGHDSLMIIAYSHTTSPLRRYIDILNQLCIKKFILGTYTKEDIKRYNELIYKICEEVNSKRKLIDSYAKEYERRLVLR